MLHGRRRGVQSLRGYLSTLHNRGVALLAALDTLVTGQPLSPSFA
jgi:hypothetical protein